MLRCFLLIGLVTLTASLTARGDGDADAPPEELDTEFVEWTHTHFPAEITETFELVGEWTEYTEEDGTLRFAATGEGDHAIHVFQTEQVVIEPLSPGSEVFWASTEDDVVTDLTIAYGTPIGEYLPLATTTPWNGAETDITRWSEANCSKRQKDAKKKWTNVWKCLDSNKKCTVKIETSSSGDSTRKGECDDKHVFEYYSGSREIIFWVE